MKVKIEESWGKVLAPEFEQSYFKSLAEFVKGEYRSHQVYPAGKDIFNAFDTCPFEKVKVVILGQDPYHGPGQAHGLAFSVPDTVPCPPSLRNILAERNRNFPNLPPRTRQDLSDWAAKGVLLLNAVLTVEHKQPASHAGKGWETITDNLLKHVLGYPTPKVFMLWGRHAQKKRALVDQYASG